MTKVLYMSDLHLEMEGWRPDWRSLIPGRNGVRHPTRGPALNRVGDVDLVILAGDIHNGLRGVVYADQVAQYFAAPVVMIAGNHEFYHHDMTVLLPAMRKAVLKTAGRVSFLQDNAADFTVGGETIHVLGCSLWTDYALNGDAPAAMAYAQRVMNDHALIKLNDLNFTPSDALGLHQASALFLHQELPAKAAAGTLAKTVVVTHHAPTAQALGRRQGTIAPAYGSEIIAQFAATPPALWVHGHTHFTHDSMVAGIHLVSAPRGYAGSGNGGYRPGLAEI
jgi:predicted phosphodiesterase